MANASSSFFYWYRRYKVRAADMTAFQTAMVETARGLGEGLVGAAVLRGFGVQGVTGFQVSIGPGISNAPTGYLGVMNESVILDTSSVSGASFPSRSLVVVTPALVDGNEINSPNTPFTQVPLNQFQEMEVQVLTGTPSATPDYPTKGPNDVVLFGLKVPAGSNSLDPSMFDYEIRDSIGANSLIGQNQVRFDNRLRPYRNAPSVLGIKPSQNIGSEPLAFSYPGRLTPSLFPLRAGSFVPEDTFIDFSTGMISGGDATTPSFSPVIAPGNNSVICVVTLTQTDTLNFNFGDTSGTYPQCLAALQNQQFSGPGSLPTPDGNFGVAYVIISSVGGNVSDVQVFDGRPFLGSGAAAAKFKKEVPTGLVNGENNEFELSKSPMDPESLDFYVDSNVLEDSDYTLSGTLVTITNPKLIPQPGQTVYAKYLIFGAVSNNSSSGIPTARFRGETPVGTIDGANAVFNLSSAPADTASLDFYVDENVLELTDFTIAGTTVTITNPDFIPQPGQTVYAKYLYLGVILGGGGGGGTSGYAALGSKSSPIVVQPSSGISPVGGDPLQTWFIRSPGGALVVTRSPQIAAGSSVGQVMKIKAVDGANYLVFQDGNGLSLDGIWPVTGQPADVVEDSSIELTWDGTNWSEDSRR